MSYTLLKSMKVMRTDGSRTVELRQPGAAVPEAATWANAALWIQRGFIQANDHATAVASGLNRSRLKPMISATEVDAERAKPKTMALEKALPEETDSKAELMEMSRKNMDAFALDQGLDPAEYSNKEKLADAILELAGE